MMLDAMAAGRRCSADDARCPAVQSGMIADSFRDHPQLKPTTYRTARSGAMAHADRIPCC